MTRAVTGYSRPLPVPQKDGCSDGKGAETLAVSRPISSLVSYAFILQCSKKQGAAKPRRRSRPKTKPEKAEPKGKSQEGFLGCGCQVGIPTFNTKFLFFTYFSPIFQLFLSYFPEEGLGRLKHIFILFRAGGPKPIL